MELWQFHSLAIDKATKAELSQETPFWHPPEGHSDYRKYEIASSYSNHSTQGSQTAKSMRYATHASHLDHSTQRSERQSTRYATHSSHSDPSTQRSERQSMRYANKGKNRRSDILNVHSNRSPNMNSPHPSYSEQRRMHQKETQPIHEPGARYEQRRMHQKETQQIQEPGARYEQRGMHQKETQQIHEPGARYEQRGMHQKETQQIHEPGAQYDRNQYYGAPRQPDSSYDYLRRGRFIQTQIDSLYKQKAIIQSAQTEHEIETVMITMRGDARFWKDKTAALTQIYFPKK